MSKKKVVVASKKKVKPTQSRKAANVVGNVAKSGQPEEMLFDKSNYMWMGIGVLLVALGMLLMVGGEQPAPNVWDPNVIYNPRITILGPIIILTGLAIEIYAIFKK